MEETHTYEVQSPSGYIFQSLYSVKYVNQPDNTRRNITGTLYVGNPKTSNPLEACTTITVQYPESIQDFEEKYQRPSIIDPTVASLILTKYYPTCTENKPLQGGEGTIEMILTAMSLIKQLCPFVKEFALNDASSKQCDNQSMISLPYFYLTQHHKTWYEAKFQARLKPDSEMVMYQKTLKYFLESPLEPFNIFSSRYLSHVNPVIQEAIRQAYEQAETVDVFFKRLYVVHGTKMVCMLLQGWIDDYMRQMKIEDYVKNHKWFIPSEAIPNYKFRNERHTHRKTQKRNNGMKQKTLWSILMGGRNRTSKVRRLPPTP